MLSTFLGCGPTLTRGTRREAKQKTMLWKQIPTDFWLKYSISYHLLNQVEILYKPNKHLDLNPPKKCWWFAKSVLPNCLCMLWQSIGIIDRYWMFLNGSESKVGIYVWLTNQITWSVVMVVRWFNQPITPPPFTSNTFIAFVWTTSIQVLCSCFLQKAVSALNIIPDFP